MLELFCSTETEVEDPGLSVLRIKHHPVAAGGDNIGKITTSLGVLSFRIKKAVVSVGGTTPDSITPNVSILGLSRRPV